MIGLSASIPNMSPSLDLLDEHMGKKAYIALLKALIPAGLTRIVCSSGLFLSTSNIIIKYITYRIWYTV